MVSKKSVFLIRVLIIVVLSCCTVISVSLISNLCTKQSVVNANDAAVPVWYKLDKKILHLSGTEQEGYTSTTDAERGWQIYSATATSVKIDNIIKPNTTAMWFNDFSKVTQITGLAYLDTSYVTEMNHMFSGCKILASAGLDLSGFNTSKTENMNGLFSGCKALTTLDLNEFDTSNVIDMSDMFADCQTLEKINVSINFNVENVKTSEDMFKGCTLLKGGKGTEYLSAITNKTFAHIDEGEDSPGYFTLTEIPVWYKLEDKKVYLSGTEKEGYTRSSDAEHSWTGFRYGYFIIENTIKPNLTKEWFDDDYNTPVYSISGLQHLDTKNVIDMSSMFDHYSGSTSLDVSGFDTGNVINMESMFRNCSTLTSLDEGDFDTGNVTNMESMFANCEALTSLDVSGFNTGKVTNMESMFANCEALTSLDVSKFDTDNVTDMGNMFCDCRSLTNLDVSRFDTGNVTNMESMFANCKALTSLDVSSFDTGNVTNMESMFANCRALTSLDVDGFDTGNVTDMGSMFYYCDSLDDLDVSGFVTGKVTEMGQMFYYCRELTSLDVGGFDTGNVTDMGRMFYDCGELTSLDVSGFETGNVTDMGFMFYGCRSLTNLDVSGFETGNVVNMSSMFQNCSKLVGLDVSGFDTGDVTDMSSMFDYCSSITSIDLSNFKTVNVSKMNRMFYECNELIRIYASADFSVANVTDSQNMFSGCSKLAGGEGTKVNDSNVDKTYAHIDGGESSPGYFTENEGSEHVHNLKKYPAAVATCTSDGHITYWYCGRCKRYFSDEEGNTEIGKSDVITDKALGHSLTEHQAKTATCTSVGNSVYWECGRCGKCFSDGNGENEYTDESWFIPKKNHTMSSHPAVPATCTDGGNIAYWYCYKCDKYYADKEGSKAIDKDSWNIPKKGHKMTSHPERPTTCTSDGNSAYWSCDRCKKYFSDKDGNSAIEKGSWITAPKMGHNMTAHPAASPAKTHTGNTAYWSCSRCGKFFSDKNGKSVINKNSWIIPIPGLFNLDNAKSRSVVYKKTKRIKISPKGKLSFESSNKKIISVSQKGIVKGKKYGKATITIKENVKGFKAVTKRVKCEVVPQKPSVKSIKITKTEYYRGGRESLGVITLKKKDNSITGYTFRFVDTKNRLRKPHSVSLKKLKKNKSNLWSKKQIVFSNPDYKITSVMISAYKKIGGKSYQSIWIQKKAVRVK